MEVKVVAAVLSPCQVATEMHHFAAPSSTDCQPRLHTCSASLLPASLIAQNYASQPLESSWHLGDATSAATSNNMMTTSAQCMCMCVWLRWVGKEDVPHLVQEISVVVVVVADVYAIIGATIWPWLPPYANCRGCCVISCPLITPLLLMFTYLHMCVCKYVCRGHVCVYVYMFFITNAKVFNIFTTWHYHQCTLPLCALPSATTRSSHTVPQPDGVTNSRIAASLAPFNSRTFASLIGKLPLLLLL